MSYNGSGTFQINTAGQPVVSGTVISSTAFNALTADLATGLSTCITKDGQTTVTANIPMGNNKITGLAVGTAATDAANLSQVQSTAAKLINSVSGADTVTGVLSPTLGAYAAGQMFYWVAAGDNTGAVTLNIDSLGAKSVTRDGSVALAAGDIKSGEVVVVVYDGTRFQVVSQLNSAGDARFANVSIASALNVGGVATFSAGTAAAPSITTSGDTNNGIFFPATDVTAITTAGSERLRVDASGNLGVGTTSPANRVDIVGDPPLYAGVDATGGTFLGYRDTLPSNSVSCFVGWIPDSIGSGGVNGDLALCPRTSASAHIRFFTGSTSATERARITSGGDLLVGGTSNTTTPTLNRGVYLQSTTNNDVIGYSLLIDEGSNNRRGSMFLDDANGVFGWDVTASSGVPDYVWRTAGSEKARITSGGDFLVGATATIASERLTVVKSIADWLVYFRNTASAGPAGIRLNYSAASPNGTGSEFLYCDDSTTARATIRSNGGIANYQGNDVNLSDERVKTDIAPLGSMWDKFKAIEIVTFKYKDQTHDDDNIGVIAQQVESVAPEFIDVDGFGETPEDGVPLKTVYTTDMYHAAIKALQEAMARIEQLEAKVAALETK